MQDKICDELDTESSSTVQTRKEAPKQELDPGKVSAGPAHRDVSQPVKKVGSRKDWKLRPEYKNQPPIRDHESFKDNFWRDKPEEEVRTRANYFKELGNDLVAEEQWINALKMYSNAIQLHPPDPVFYANRALCHLKLQELKEAEHDCDTALQIDDKYVKAYLRRATALQLQEKYSLAKEDFLTVLHHEPNNSFAKEGVKKVDQSLKNSQNQSSSAPKLEDPKDHLGKESDFCLSSSGEGSKDMKLDSLVLKTWSNEKNDIKIMKGAEKKPAHLQSIFCSSPSIKKLQHSVGDLRELHYRLN